MYQFEDLYEDRNLPGLRPCHKEFYLFADYYSYGSDKHVAEEITCETKVTIPKLILLQLL